MTRTASAGEIRASYRALAIQHHPDKHPEGASRRLAVERMADINAAWSILSDDSKRRAYDRQIAANTQNVAADGAPQSASGAASKTEADEPRYASERVFDESADAFPLSERVSAPIAMAGFIPAVALALVLIAIFVFTAYAGGSNQEPASGGNGEPMVAIRDLRGQCIQQSGGFILVVNCAITPHEGRIVAQASLDANCPAGTQAWVVRQQQVQACVDPATAVP